MLSNHGKNVIEAYELGYRVIDGKTLNPKGEKLKTNVDSNGYDFFTIRTIRPGTRKVYTHRLVAYQKFGDILFKPKLQVRHLDNNRQNNLDENIGIGTQSQNMMDIPKKKRIEMSKKGREAARKVNKKYDYEEIKRLHSLGYSYSDIMKETGITSKGTISYIINS